MRPNREEFIDLFFEHGMLAHMYLNHKRLHNLFENAHDRDFFVGVCLEGVLGKSLVRRTLIFFLPKKILLTFTVEPHNPH